MIDQVLLVVDVGTQSLTLHLHDGYHRRPHLRSRCVGHVQLQLALILRCRRLLEVLHHVVGQLLSVQLVVGRAIDGCADIDLLKHRLILTDLPIVTLHAASL